MATITTMTGAAFDQLPYEEGRHLELLDGEVIELSTPTPEHQDIAQNLLVSLHLYFRHQPIGRVLQQSEFSPAPNDRYQPDVAIVLGERARSFDNKRTPIPLAPDIAIEVLSPSETGDESRCKVLRYLKTGVREVWQFASKTEEVFVHYGPKSITVLGIDDTLKTDLLPGWEISIREVFSVCREDKSST